MSMALGMSWLKHQRYYALRFGGPVPDWLCMCDLPLRLPLVRSALRLGWRLSERFLHGWPVLQQSVRGHVRGL